VPKTFHADHVSVDEAGGECFQILFEQRGKEADQYLLIQRWFEVPDGGKCYVEDNSLAMTGHFRVRRAELGRGHFYAELAAPQEHVVNITFTLTEAEFANTKRVVRTMIPHAIFVERYIDSRPRSRR
jgi:hypothetical protein